MAKPPNSETSKERETQASALMASYERQVIENIRMAESCLDDAENSAKVLALDLMGFAQARKILRGLKAEMALRIFLREQS